MKESDTGATSRPGGLSRIAPVALGLLALLAGCSGGGEESTRPVVVVSVPPQAYFVERVAGDLVEVEVMIPPGASPATYAPTMRQMKAVSKARLYVEVGHPNFPFEVAWGDELASQNPDLRVVDGSAGIDLLEGDPHVWCAPGSVRIMTATIAEALTEMLPEHTETFAENLRAFTKEIDALDEEIRAALAEHEGEKFLVFHPAWGYFAEEYGLVQVSIEHDHKEPGADHLHEMIELAREEGIRVVFQQEQFPTASAELVAKEIGGAVETVDPLARDWLENLRRAAATFQEAFAK